jgi:PKD repeat protein
MNANGRIDFDDVVTFFGNMDWITANEPLSLFDFNGNGRIDFADVVLLYDEV